MQGHVLPCQTRTGISGWSFKRRQDLPSCFEVFLSRQEVRSFKNYRESHHPHRYYANIPRKTALSEGRRWASFPLTALLSACPLACPCPFSLLLNGICTPRTSACGLKGSIPWCGEQRKNQEPETNLIILLYPDHILIMSVFSSFCPKRTNISQRMHIKEKHDSTAGDGGSYFYVGVKKKMKGA